MVKKINVTFLASSFWFISLFLVDAYAAGGGGTNATGGMSGASGLTTAVK
jgi:hypothetical protein